MRFLTTPLLLLLFQVPPPPAHQVCSYQTPGFSGFLLGSCPAAVPPAWGSITGTLTDQKDLAAALASAGANLPASVVASTLPQNSLGIVMKDGTVIPISVINPTSIAKATGPNAAAAVLASVTPVIGNGEIPLVVPVFTTTYQLPGKPYVQAHLAGWQLQP